VTARTNAPQNKQASHDAHMCVLAPLPFTNRPCNEPSTTNSACV